MGGMGGPYGGLLRPGARFDHGSITPPLPHYAHPYDQGMGILIGLVVLVIFGGLILAGIGAFAGGGIFFWMERSRKKAEENAPAILNAAFDGGEDVVFKVNMETPSYETVVLGAKQRGYRFSSETNDSQSGSAKTLIFEKRSDI